MSIHISDRQGLLNKELRGFLERRLLFALSRFDSRVNSIEVVVKDENGPRGGIDKVCRVSIALNRAEDVIVKETDTDLIACLARVAERAGRVVARSIDRSKGFERPTRAASVWR